MARRKRTIPKGPQHITARFKGVCAECKQSFEAGTPIVWVGKGQAYHEACYKDQKPKEEPKRETPQEPQARPEQKEGPGRLHFESPFDLLDYVNTNPFPNAHSKEDMRGGFCEYSWKESIKALTSGFTTATDKIQALAEVIENSISEEKAATVRYDVAGDFIDVGAYLSGVPECFGLIEETETREKPEINILVSCLYSSGVSQDTIINRGAAITALIDNLLQTNSVRVRFEIDATSTGKGTPFLMTFEVNTENNYSRDLVAFYAAHPAMLRRFGHCCVEIVDNKASCGGYLRVNVVDKTTKDTIYFPALMGNPPDFRSVESSYEYVKGVLAQYQQ